MSLERAQRYAKILLMASVALFSVLVVCNNVTDYGSNFEFVRHVLMMDTTFPGNAGLWRALESPLIHHAAYLVLIGFEAVIAALAVWGAGRLWRQREDAAAFNRAKVPAFWSLVLGITLWFGGFIAIGGEWFLMWQSETWNGQQAAFRITAIFALILVFLVRDDRD